MPDRGDFLPADILAIFMILVTIIVAFVIFNTGQYFKVTKEKTLEGVEIESARSSIIGLLNKQYKGVKVYGIVTDYCNGKNEGYEIIKASKEGIWDSLMSLELNCKNKKLMIRPYMCDEYAVHLLDGGFGPGEIKINDEISFRYCHNKGFLKTYDGRIWIANRKKEILPGGRSIDGRNKLVYHLGWEDDEDVLKSDKNPNYYLKNFDMLYSEYLVYEKEKFLRKYKNWDFESPDTIEVFRDE
jgi:hypothetical protein